MADRGGRALERVGRPEHLVEQDRVRGPALEHQQAALDLLDLLERLVRVQPVVSGLEIELEPHQAVSRSTMWRRTVPATVSSGTARRRI